MTRITDATLIAALEAENVRELVLVELEFDSGTVYAHSGIGDFVWDGNTYLGVGSLGQVSPIEEGNELKNYGFSLGLSGIDPALVAVSMLEHYQGRPARIRLAFLDEDYQLIGDPVGPWTGRMDTMDGEVGEQGQIVLAVESRLVDWERARIRRYTDADQQAEYPGDLGLEFVNQMVEKELIWGRSL